MKKRDFRADLNSGPACPAWEAHPVGMTFTNSGDIRLTDPAVLNSIWGVWSICSQLAVCTALRGIFSSAACFGHAGHPPLPKYSYIGAVAKWPKATDCKSVIRRFESARHLFLLFRDPPLADARHGCPRGDDCSIRSDRRTVATFHSHRQFNSKPVRLSCRIPERGMSATGSPPHSRGTASRLLADCRQALLHRANTCRPCAIRLKPPHVATGCG